MEWSQWIVFLVITFIKVVASVEPLGFKNTTLVETGEGVLFEWFQKDAMNRSHAIEFCDSLRSTIPNVRELRYFYKSLSLEANSTFYLKDVIETTTDSPRDDIGERLCITIKNNPGNPLQMGETNAKSSCSTRANSIVCRRTNSAVDSTLYSKCLEGYFRDNTEENIIKLERTSFFFILGAICLVLLITNCLWIIFCYKYCSTKQKRSNSIRAKTPSLFTENGLKHINFSADGSDLGRYDLLPDVQLQRESYRKSQKPKHDLRVATKKDNAETQSTDLGPDSKSADTDATGFL